MDIKYKLVLLQFNNYFNRTIRLFSKIDDYISHSKKSLYAVDSKGNVADISFNPNDGVTTQSVINWSEEWNPDYLLVIGDNGKIVSRWFITESTRIMYSQYRMSLRRDVIAEKYSETVNAPCFIEKGYVLESNPLIFNKENFFCNQIKKNEVLIRDNAYISWIILYYAKDKKSELSGTVSLSNEKYIDTESTLEDFVLKKYIDNGYNIPRNRKVKVQYANVVFLNERYLVFDDSLNVIENKPEDFDNDSELDWDGSGNGSSEIINNLQDNKTTILTHLNDFDNPELSFEDLMEWNDKIIKTTDEGGKYYRITISFNGKKQYSKYLDSGLLYDALCNSFKIGGSLKEGWQGGFTKAFSTIIDADIYSVNIYPAEITTETISYNFTQTNNCEDEPYGIICFPYKANDKYNRSIKFDSIYSLDERIAVAIVNSLTAAGVGTEEKIYDAQIVPYCPFDINSLTLVNDIEIQFPDDWTEGEEYTYIKNSSNEKICFSLHPKTSKFTKFADLTTEISIDCPFIYTNGKKDYKSENELSFFRISSPNYNGIFEFSRAKNRGLDIFKIDCHYKPYNPYIHVAPNFGGLFGEDFNDARGLICSGDFSMSVVSDKYEEYKLQNKNFNEIFARQIESLDIQHDIQQSKNIASLGISAAKGAIGGAIAGTNPATIALGAVAGLTSGIINISSSEKQYRDNRDATIDQHNFQLANIQAIPNSLNRVDSYNSNNKIFPFLEWYTCTDEEKEIFRDKIKYEGMTVNALGKIITYINRTNDDFTFVKGKIIRLDSIDEDSHFSYTIAEEIEKGVYIKDYTEEL